MLKVNELTIVMLEVNELTILPKLSKTPIVGAVFTRGVQSVGSIRNYSKPNRLNLPLKPTELIETSVTN